MDIALLVKILAPCLPFLMGLGQKAVEKGAEKLGEMGAEGMLPQARKIWEKLHPKVEAKAAAKEAAEDVAKSPDDADAVAALRQQLKKILEAPENAGLVAEIKEILAEAEKNSADGAKFNFQMKDSQAGVIGDYGTATQYINTKPKE
jgi:hypothetical protein